MSNGGDRAKEFFVTSVLACALGGLVGYSMSDRPAAAIGEQAASANSSSEAPTCKSLGLTATSTREVTCRTRTALLTFVNDDHEIVVPGFSARVQSASAFEAATPEGRARQRMRVRLRLVVAVTAGRAALPPSTDDVVYLSIGGKVVKPDRSYRARDAFSLREPVKPGATRRGVIHFELSGDTSERFVRSGGQLALRPFPSSEGTQQIAIMRISPPKQVRRLPAEEPEQPAATGDGSTGAATTPGTETTPTGQ
jgi:hypothetical protein